MNANEPSSAVTRHDIAAWTVAGVALLLVLLLHLLPALLAGLLVYELVHILAARLILGRLRGKWPKIVAVAVIASLIVAAVTVAFFGTVAFFRSEAGNLPTLLQKMAEILESSRALLPGWMVEHLPASADALRDTWVRWLRTHAADVQLMGKEAVRAAAHILVGIVIGAMVSLREAIPAGQSQPLARALIERAHRLAEAFRRIVFAQVRIAAINAFFTGIYLVVVLPLFGVHLPLTKTLVGVTFVVGLLPVIGNLISNTIIVIVSLSHSLPVAIASLAFLVVIHKLEYFLNAHIVGSRIRARPWELLSAMLLMEAAFGAPGLIAAPIYYAYVKDELSCRGLV